MNEQERQEMHDRETAFQAAHAWREEKTALAMKIARLVAESRTTYDDLHDLWREVERKLRFRVDG